MVPRATRPPRPRPGRTGSAREYGRVFAVLIHDRALLDDEDIYSAAFLCYGKSDGPLVKRIGQRWFLAPGPVGSAGGGPIVLDGPSDEVLATFYDAEGRAGQALTLITTIRAAKLSVQGQ